MKKGNWTLGRLGAWELWVVAYKAQPQVPKRQGASVPLEVNKR